MKKQKLFIIIAIVLFSIPIIILLINGKKNDNPDTKNQTTEQSSTRNEEEDAFGTIYVEAGTGTLTNAGDMSYIGESARGLEAYLAEREATASYKFTVELPGNYVLRLSLSDDASHPDNSRDVTIVINNTQTLVYKQVSEDTEGWNWYSVGVTNLEEGENSITFTKNETTSAAFVMDAFKLIPIE